MENKYIIDLEERLKKIIQTKCNIVGCINCDLKNGDDTCSATDLQNKIMDIEFKNL